MNGVCTEMTAGIKVIGSMGSQTGGDVAFGKTKVVVDDRSM